VEIAGLQSHQILTREEFLWGSQTVAGGVEWDCWCREYHISASGTPPLEIH
jgi:hypothetical protein